MSSLSTYGYGIDIDTIGGLTTYGFCVSPLGPIINAAISFSTNMDIDVVTSLTIDKDISFSLDLLASINRYLEVNPNVQFDLITAVQVATEGNIYNPEVDFNTSLNAEFVKQLITDAGIDFDTQLTQDQAAFLLQFFLAKQNIYAIPEELRFLKVFAELRTCEVSEESRAETVKFEDRVVIVPIKEE